ncbi:MAG: hypothetical protein SFW35_09845 [Chitinophagales bacterium]|nr:hypothetical protein [Chitinophagales bacterium]
MFLLPACTRCAECVGGRNDGDVFCRSPRNLDEKRNWEEHCLERGGEILPIR